MNLLVNYPCIINLKRYIKFLKKLFQYTFGFPIFEVIYDFRDELNTEDNDLLLLFSFLVFTEVITVNFSLLSDNSLETMSRFSKN